MRGKGSAKRIVLLSLFLASALVLGIVERSVPVDFALPGIRLGLANAAVLCVLYLFGFRDAILVAAAKCVIISIYSGSMLSFFYSFTGSMLSVAAMAVMIKVFTSKISEVGVSVAGAAMHNTGQLLAASLAMRTTMVFAYFPALMVSAVVTGLIIGFAVRLIHPVIGKL